MLRERRLATVGVSTPRAVHGSAPLPRLLKVLAVVRLFNLQPIRWYLVA